jgi:hypothetical protein
MVMSFDAAAAHFVTGKERSRADAPKISMRGEGECPGMRPAVDEA